MSPERVTAIATVIYMGFTGRLIKETRKSRKLQEDPSIDIFVEPSEHWGQEILLVIQNNGGGGAYDIKLSADKEMYVIKMSDNSDFNKLTKKGFFVHGIPFLPSKGKRSIVYTLLTTDYDKKINEEVSINVNYKTKFGLCKKGSYVISLSEFDNTRLAPTPPIYEISKNIEKIQKDINSVISGFKEVKVLTQIKHEKHEEC